MDDDPVLLYMSDKLCKIFVEMFDYFGADGVSLLAFSRPIWQGRQCVDTPIDTAFGVGIQGSLQG